MRSSEHGAVALGADGAHYLAENRVEGVDPLADFSPTAPQHLLRTDGFEHVADIMVGSFYDPRSRRGLRLRGADLVPRRSRRPADQALHPAPGVAADPRRADPRRGGRARDPRRLARDARRPGFGRSGVVATAVAPGGGSSSAAGASSPGSVPFFPRLAFISEALTLASLYEDSDEDLPARPAEDQHDEHERVARR